MAPIRICDNGGWTDTWFARYGKIFNIAVSPYAQVQVAVYPSGSREHIVVHAENYDERYVVQPDHHWGRHPLIEATIEYMRVPSDMCIEVTIFSKAPSGASTGTSAAMTVALIAALDQLAPGYMSPHEMATAAHRIETELLHQQSGIQDQLGAAYGGINLIEMVEYPQASVSAIQVPPAIARELERRLVLIYLGKSHHSSQIHETVIQSLTDAGPDCKPLNDLRRTAERSRDALYAGDFAAFGSAMIDNTDAQGRLHPSLISADAQRVIDIAQAHGAVGWKVNGAGGEGGSITLLGNEVAHAKREMVRQIEQAHRLYKNIPINLSSTGVCVWRVRDNMVIDGGA
ncbi:MAG: GHMP kinase [Chloroflexi bacterium]|nr:GHMP kinase [Chloroflexota bacterium]